MEYTPDPSWIHGPVYRDETPTEIKLDTLLDRAYDMTGHPDRYTPKDLSDMLDECYYWSSTVRYEVVSDDLRERLKATINVLEGMVD